MSRLPGARWLLLSIWLAAVPAGAYSLRSTELLRYECRQGETRRDITLFGNGTVRAREGPLAAQSLRLVDLDPKELESTKRLLRRVDLSETESRYEGVEEERAEICRVFLDVEGTGGPSVYEFGPLDAVSLGLSQVVDLAEQLGRRARAPGVQEVALPDDYQPRSGDVLRRFDGVRFEVLGLSADGFHVELEGIEQPLTVVVPIDDLGEVFDVLESRRSSRAER